MRVGINLGIYRGGRSKVWTPADLYGVNDRGNMITPWDLRTLWSNVSRTTNATIGGTVALADDKSGQNRNYTSGTAANRPTVTLIDGRTGLTFDTSDTLASAAFAWGSPSFTLCIALNRKVQVIGDTNGRNILSLGAPLNTSGFSAMAYGASTGVMYQLRAVKSGEALIQYGTNQNVFQVVTFRYDGAALRMNIRINGVQVSNTTAGVEVGNFPNNGLLLGASSSVSLGADMSVYGMMTINRAMSDADCLKAERYFGRKSLITVA